MDQAVMDSIDTLAEKLKKRPCANELKIAQKNMERDPEVFKLYLAYKKAQEDYNDVLTHYEMDSPEAKGSQKVLYQMKLNLDLNPLVRHYYEVLSEYNEPLLYLEFNLLGKFRS